MFAMLCETTSSAAYWAWTPRSAVLSPEKAGIDMA
jgi:hypothetical protein